MMRGSSPLARGLLIEGPRGTRVVGIIPARAGFTRALPLPPRSLRGSSPLARGLRPSGCGRAQLGGIIPARAGFTSRMASTRSSRRDHPRSRGVYIKDGVNAEFETGSSPLARGLQSTHDAVALVARIIPARAGFTGVPDPGALDAADHPRSRGVYLQFGRLQIHIPGSSPLARGLRRRAPAGHDAVRIIPARAGFTRQL